jgi:hypothetical protein
MISKREFYKKNDVPGSFGKSRMWNNIRKELISNYLAGDNSIEWRSFFYGIAAAVILFFTLVGFYTVLDTVSDNQKPQIVHITEAYRNTAAKLESIIPEKLMSDQSVDIDEQLLPKKEKLIYVNEAISDLQTEYNKNDYSKLKLQRLYSLYKMKLEILEEIIAMEDI